MTEDGAATETQHTGVKAIHWWFLLPHHWAILIGVGVLLEDMVVVWVGEDVRSVTRMRASVAGHRVYGI